MKFIRKLLIIVIIFLISIASIVAFSGFAYYSSKLKEKPLVTRVQEITNKEHFVNFSDMSTYYRNAVISVEDHRYYDHGPVDFIAIGRALFTNVKMANFKKVVAL